MRDELAGLYKALEVKDEVIESYAEIIDVLFCQLCQHLSYDEIARLSIVEKMEEAAKKAERGGQK